MAVLGFADGRRVGAVVGVFGDGEVVGREGEVGGWEDLGGGGGERFVRSRRLS